MKHPILTLGPSRVLKKLSSTLSCPFLKVPGSFRENRKTRANAPKSRQRRHYFPTPLHQIPWGELIKMDSSESFLSSLPEGPKVTWSIK